MPSHLPPIDADLSWATTLVRRWVDPALTVTAIRPLRGGSINEVRELETDAAGSIVLKANSADYVGAFRQEFGSHQYFHRQTSLPVPAPFAVVEDDPDLPGSAMLMEKVAGVPLASARLSDRGALHAQAELAEHVVELHRHTRDRFGSVLSDKGYANWLTSFGPRLQQEFEGIRDQISTPARETIDHVVLDLAHYLPMDGAPTLVHGDLWANNILVDDSHPDRPVITAFIDGRAAFCDPEYELAYLQLFKTADDSFFRHYHRHHPPRPGFDGRCRIYWLESMMRHLRLFGDRYRASVEDLADQIRRRA